MVCEIHKKAQENHFTDFEKGKTANESPLENFFLIGPDCMTKIRHGKILI